MAKRRTKAEIKIEKFLTLLKNNCRIEKVIIFGSFVRGKQKRWSDIDLAIISDDFNKMNFHQRLVFLGMLAWQAKATEIEALGYTLDEYKMPPNWIFWAKSKERGKLFMRNDRFWQEEVFT